MGRSAIDYDWELTAPANGVRTVVLVGRTGSGKSATGNSILGRKAFKSRATSSGVTSTCELQKTILKDGQIINVIDTPGLFDFSMRSELIGKEIVKCIDLAKDGIHAVLVVFSVRTRFSKEEEAVLQNLQNFFGPRITDYMIVVFTGGDELEENDESLDDYLGRECPDPLKDVICSCKNKVVLFDNKNKDEVKKSEQLQKLLTLVNMVITENDGQPYTDELFGALKVDSKLRETIYWLEQQLAEEHAARLQAEVKAQEAQKRSNDEILKLRENLEKAQKKKEDLALQAEVRAQEAQKRSNDEIFKLGENLEKALKKKEELALQEEVRAQEAQKRSNDEIRKLRENLEKARKKKEDLALLAEVKAQEAQKRSDDEIRKLRENLEKAQKDKEELEFQVEVKAQEAQIRSNDEIRKHREYLEKVQNEIEQLRKVAQSGECVIM